MVETPPILPERYSGRRGYLIVYPQSGIEHPESETAGWSDDSFGRTFIYLLGFLGFLLSDSLQ